MVSHLVSLVLNIYAVNAYSDCTHSVCLLLLRARLYTFFVTNTRWVGKDSLKESFKAFVYKACGDCWLSFLCSQKSTSDYLVTTL